MSCIPHLLKLKEDKEYMQLNSVAMLESGGNYKDHDFCITFTDMGTRCGYVAVPANSKHIKNEGFDIAVHGGITFCDKPSHLVDDELLGKDDCGDFWLGFDAAHAWDLQDYDVACKLFPKKYIVRLGIYSDDSEIRTNEYMVEECKKVIDQLVR